MNRDHLLAEAVEYHRAGNLPEAEKRYRLILRQDPRQPDALQLLGVLAHQVGQSDAAVELIRQAILLRPAVSEYHNNLGEALQRLNRFTDAIAAYREAIRLNPKYPEAYNNLGNALRNDKKLAEATGAYETAILLRPDYAEAHNNLGNALSDLGKTERAIACYQTALALRPQVAEFHNNVGVALRRAGRLDESARAFRRSIELGPRNALAHNNLGCVLKQLGRLGEAVPAFEHALALDPEFADAYANLGDTLTALGRHAEAVTAFRHSLHRRPDSIEVYNNLGGALKDLGRLEEALAAYENALRINPRYAIAHYNRGVLLRDQGDIPRAIDAFRGALAINPTYATAHSGLTFALLYLPDASPEAILQEHRRWNEAHAKPLEICQQSHYNTPNPARRLRVGYVSADFRDHAVGRNIHPLLVHHDHRMFEIFAYASVTGPDAFSERLRGLTDFWRDVRSVDDTRLAEFVRKDGIDILVDLGLHTGGHRLLTFARKPAPVQITFAGYPGTTGLDAIDYRLTDPYLDPPGENDRYYAERSLRLSHCFWCFDPIDDDPGLPARHPRKSGVVTWGCLNNPLKINDAVLELWSRILKATPASRMLILTYNAKQRERISATLRKFGVETSRLEFLLPQRRPEYLAAYNRCDIILDTFPYNGHTTTCDALWMGVPVVTLTGSHALARGGFSLLSNIGVSCLAANSAEDYVKIALDLAEDTERLGGLHASLRTRMERSPVMDAKGFARDIENAFRKMWRNWCDANQQ